MGNRLRRLLKSKSDAQVSFKLSPGKNAEVEVRDNGIFRMTWKSSGKPKHRWYSEGGKSGRIDAKYISHEKRWKDAFDDKGVGQKYLYGEELAKGEKNIDNKVIGLMSSINGDNLFLYEQERIRFNEDKGKVSFRGKLLSSQFVVEHAEELAFAFGSKVVRNHLLMERGWRDGKKASLENFSAMMSANVSDDFWNDHSKNHRLHSPTSLQKNFQGKPFCRPSSLVPLKGDCEQPLIQKQKRALQHVQRRIERKEACP